MSKVQNIRNSIWNIVDVSIYPVCFLALTPFFINHFGEKVFGLWMLLNSLLITFQIFNFGLAPATVKYVAEFNHLKESEKVKRVINTNLSISFLLMLISYVLGGILVVGVYRNAIFNFDDHFSPFAAKAIFIFVLIIGLKFTEQILLNVFKGFERFDIYALLNLIIRVGGLGINVFQVMMGYSFHSLLIANLCITIGGQILALLLLKYIFPLYKPGFSLNREMVSLTGIFGLYHWFQSLIVIAVFQVDRFLVVTYFGLEKLGYYVVAATMLISIHVVFSAFATWLVPKMIRYQEDEEKSRQLYLTMRAFIVMISLFCLNVFFILYRPVFGIIMGPEKFLNIRPYISLFVVYELFNMLIIVPPLYLNYTGKIKAGTFIIYINSILNIAGFILGFIFTRSVEGMLFGLISSAVVSSIIVSLYMKRFGYTKTPVGDTVVFICLSGASSLLNVYENAGIQIIFFLIIAIASYLFFFKKEKVDLKFLFD